MEYWFKEFATGIREKIRSSIFLGWILGSQLIDQFFTSVKHFKVLKDFKIIAKCHPYTQTHSYHYNYCLINFNHY